MASHRSSSTPPASAATGVQHLPVAPLTAAPPSLDHPPVEVRVSNRRKKSAAAFFEHGSIVVVVLARLSASQRQDLVDRLVRRMLARGSSGAAAGDAVLEARARHLAATYLDGVRPSSVRWVTNQRSRWASCTPTTGQIRVSHRLKLVPEWVLDAVLVHELAHLLVPSHSPAFRALENRYPRRHDADIYLAGYQLGMGTAPAGGEPSLDDDPEAADCGPPVGSGATDLSDLTHAAAGWPLRGESEE